MNKKRILIIGAGFLQSFVIRKAKELGYYTLTVDMNPRAFGFQYADEYAVIDITDERSCYKYAMGQKIDGVLTAATDYGVLTANYIAEQMKLPGIHYNIAKIIKNKYEVRKKLFEKNVDDTKQTYEISCENDIKKTIDTVEFPVMVKPCDGSGSRGASKVNQKDEFYKACIIAMEQSLIHKAVIESFINGQEYGVESFVYGDEIFVMTVMRKWMTDEPYYAELGHSIPSMLTVEIENKIKTCVKSAIRALEINYGSVNMDILLGKDNSVHIVDIGARMGGNLIGSHIIPLGTGIDYMTMMIRAAAEDFNGILGLGNGKNVVTRLLALTPGKVIRLPDMCSVEKQFNVNIYHHLNVGDDISEYHTNLDGCGYIVAVSDNYAEALNNAVDALKYIDENIQRE